MLVLYGINFILLGFEIGRLIQKNIHFYLLVGLGAIVTGVGHRNEVRAE